VSIPLTGMVAGSVPEGITNPPIDDLLGQVSSKYALVIYAAKRARQKPLSIAMREIQAGMLEHTEGTD